MSPLYGGLYGLKYKKIQSHFRILHKKNASKLHQYLMPENAHDFNSRLSTSETGDLIMSNILLSNPR